MATALVASFLTAVDHGWAQPELVLRESVVCELPAAAKSNHVVISPDNEHYAYLDFRGDGVRVVTDGVQGKLYESISGEGPVFSGDSRHVAYVPRRVEGPLVVVIDKTEYLGGKDYSWLFGQTLVLSADGKHWACTAKAGDHRMVVIDGAEKGRGHSATVSPDGARSGWVAQRDGVAVVVIDGKDAGSYEQASAIVFSPDSKRVAWLAMRDGKQFAVVDGIETPSYDRFATPVAFDPTGLHVAYVACKGSALDAAAMLGMLSQRSRLVVVDGAVKGRYGGAAALSFGPAGKRVAWVAGNTSSEQFVVVDGVESARREMIGSGGLRFSPSGRRVAYWAREKGRWLIVVDDAESAERFDSIPRGSAPVFDDDVRVHAMVLKKNTLVRVDVEIRQ